MRRLEQLAERFGLAAEPGMMDTRGNLYDPAGNRKGGHIRFEAADMAGVSVLVFLGYREPEERILDGYVFRLWMSWESVEDIERCRGFSQLAECLWIGLPVDSKPRLPKEAHVRYLCLGAVSSGLDWPFFQPIDAFLDIVVEALPALHLSALRPLVPESGTDLHEAGETHAGEEDPTGDSLRAS